MDNQLYDVLISALVVGFLAIVLGLAIWWHHSRSELRLREFEVRHRVLEKFADSDAFLAFARTEEGRRLLLPAPEPARNGRLGWLRLVQIGLLVFAIGIGGAVASARSIQVTTELDRYRKENLSTWSTLFVCAGIALTASGALARWLDRR